MRHMTILLATMATLLLAVTPVSASHVERQTADVLEFADVSDHGNARLWRTDNGVTTVANAGDIPAGVYTMWWVVWNTPEGCATPWACVEADLFNPNAGLAIGYAGGTVVSANENLTVAASLREGRTLQGFPYPEFQSIGVQVTETTLVDSNHAEIHLVFRTHGDPIPGLIPDQIRTFNGGCVYEAPISGSEPSYGAPGAHACTDTFFTVFPSINTP